MAKRSTRSGEQVDAADAQLDGFLAKYTTEIERLARECRAKMQKLLPGATELVYDNYNGLVIGFGPSDRASEALFSIVMYPKWINLFFLQGAHMSDPNQLLKGAGSVVRHIRIAAASDLDRKDILDLIHTALMNARKPIDPAGKGILVIKSIAAKQRARR